VLPRRTFAPLRNLAMTAIAILPARLDDRRRFLGVSSLVEVDDRPARINL